MLSLNGALKGVIIGGDAGEYFEVQVGGGAFVSIAPLCFCVGDVVDHGAKQRVFRGGVGRGAVGGEGGSDLRGQPRAGIGPGSGGQLRDIVSQ